MAAKPKPEAPKRKKSEELDKRPVRFTCTAGIVWIKSSRNDLNAATGVPTFVPGLRLIFTPDGDPDGRPIGGISREFLPAEKNHDPDTELCDCKHCLADVRRFIEDRRNRDVVSKHHLREMDPDAGVKSPFSKWDEPLTVSELGELHKSVGFDLEAALRYERKNLNREAVIDKLEELIEDGAEISGDDVLSAEVELG